jgi:23S rRNA (pseudouridine1915-N3)-methyltransferase
MKLVVAAVGVRMPAWVEVAFGEFAGRMPRELPLHLREVKAEPRSGGKPVEALLAAEAARIRDVLPARCRLVALDEHGGDLTTRDLAQRLEKWMETGSDIAFVIGGPDGLAPEIKSSAAETLRLSSLTLPHALVRVVLAEALYRAASLLRGHPYHRE